MLRKATVWRPTATSIDAARLEAALAALAGARATPRSGGGRRRSTSSAAPSATCCSGARPRRHRRRRRGRRGRARRCARRRGARARALRHRDRRASATIASTSPQPGRETLRRAPARCPTCGPRRSAEDLARRDFTVNAMALPLEATPELIDPHGGRGRPRARHSSESCIERSFIDDPTRALRAARYARAARLRARARDRGAVRDADLETVSSDRGRAPSWRLLAAEPTPAARLRAARRSGGWPLLDDGAASSIDAGRCAVLEDPAWSRRRRARRRRCRGGPARGEARRAAAAAARARHASRAASEGVALAAGSQPRRARRSRGDRARMARRLRRASGATSALEIGGDDLIEAGVPRGPGRRAAGWTRRSRRKLDGEIDGPRGRSSTAALAAARAEGPDSRR